MANKEIQVEAKVESYCPGLTGLFGIVRRADADIQFLLARLQAIHALPGKWRAAASSCERCAFDDGEQEEKKPQARVLQ